MLRGSNTVACVRSVWCRRFRRIAITFEPSPDIGLSLVIKYAGMQVEGARAVFDVGAARLSQLELVLALEALGRSMIAAVCCCAWYS